MLRLANDDGADDNRGELRRLFGGAFDDVISRILGCGGTKASALRCVIDELRRIARTTCGRAGIFDSDDAAAKVLLMAVEGRLGKQYVASRGSRAAWRAGLVRYVFFRGLRQEARHNNAVSLSERTEDPRDAEPCALERTEREAGLARVRDAVERLPCDERAEVLRRIGELSDGTNVGSLKTAAEVRRPNYPRRTRLWHRALKRLRADLVDLEELL